MFRQEESFVGGWQEKTLEAMQQRRFKQMVEQLPPLGTQRLEELSPAGVARRIEQCWQNVARKPMRAQQLSEVWRSVLSGLEAQADCLSHDEHELVERALILGGSAQIEDMRELEAARALSLRLWASVGLVDGRPYVELEAPVLRPAARAFARMDHGRIRRRFESFGAYLDGILYRVGALDDRQPQQMIIRDVLRADGSEQMIELARRYLWASCDCVDYSGGVLLLHPALAEPRSLIAEGRRRPGAALPLWDRTAMRMDILPEEIPLQRRLEYAIKGTLRAGYQEQEAARSIRFLCKQGAPLSAMEEVLQSMLIVLVTPSMRGALGDMYYGIPKWIECMEQTIAQ